MQRKERPKSSNWRSSQVPSQRHVCRPKKMTQLPAHCQCEVGLALHSSSIKAWQAWISIPVSSSTPLNHVWMVALWSLVEEKPNRKNSLSTFLAPVKWLSKKIVRKQIPISWDTLTHFGVRLFLLLIVVSLSQLHDLFFLRRGDWVSASWRQVCRARREKAEKKGTCQPRWELVHLTGINSTRC